MNLVCPSCGASLDIEVGLTSIVCKYCNTISLVERNSLKSTGEKSCIMPFPTIFEVGKYFYAILNNASNDKINGKNVLYISEEEFRKNHEKFIGKFYVYGQIRYTNEGGFWDDFFVRILEDNENLDKNKEYILGENEGLISLYKIEKNTNDFGNEIFENKSGTSFSGYFVQEKGTTSIEGFKGSFPFNLYNTKDSNYTILLKDGKVFEFKSIGNEILELIGV